MAGLEEGYSPLAKIFSLRHWRASSPMAYAQMRTPFCDSESRRGALESSLEEGYAARGENCANRSASV